VRGRFQSGTSPAQHRIAASVLYRRVRTGSARLPSSSVPISPAFSRLTCLLFCHAARSAALYSYERGVDLFVAFVACIAIPVNTERAESMLRFRADGDDAGDGVAAEITYRRVALPGAGIALPALLPRSYARRRTAAGGGAFAGARGGHAFAMARRYGRRPARCYAYWRAVHRYVPWTSSDVSAARRRICRAGKKLRGGSAADGAFSLAVHDLGACSGCGRSLSPSRRACSAGQRPGAGSGCSTSPLPADPPKGCLFFSVRHLCGRGRRSSAFVYLPGMPALRWRAGARRGSGASSCASAVTRKGRATLDTAWHSALLYLLAVCSVPEKEKRSSFLHHTACASWKEGGRWFCITHWTRWLRACGAVSRAMRLPSPSMRQAGAWHPPAMLCAPVGATRAWACLSSSLDIFSCSISSSVYQMVFLARLLVWAGHV